MNLTADILVTLGAVAVIVGAYLAWAPAAWIVGGLLLVAAGVMLVCKPQQEKRK